MFRESIVTVGMPRSGTSWLSQIVDSSPQVRFRLSPFFSYAFKNAVNEYSSKEEYERVFQGAYHSDDVFMCRTKERQAGNYPVFEKKDNAPEFLAIKMTRFHNLIFRMLTLFDNLKIVSIVRHPCGVIHSWLTTPKEFPSDANPMQEWRAGTCRKTGPGEFWGFDDWKSVTHFHIDLEQKFPKRFIILQYETLVDHPARETRKLFDFLGLAYTEQTSRFLRSSHQHHAKDPYAVFKSPDVKDRWREELNPIIREAIINEIEDTDLRRFLK